jgi:hypothetical protein
VCDAGWPASLLVVGRVLQVTQDAAARQLLSKALAIDELEGSVPRWE